MCAYSPTAVAFGVDLIKRRREKGRAIPAWRVVFGSGDELLQERHWVGASAPRLITKSQKAKYQQLKT